MDKPEGSLVDCSGTALFRLRETKHLEEDGGEIEVCVNGSEIWKRCGCGPLTFRHLLNAAEGKKILPSVGFT
ncbi:MAG: hypothetical protein U9N48_08880 [Euryarchaeota archaeon]|nr:hypothetical protein [Euryarchaeota archaeon]